MFEAADDFESKFILWRGLPVILIDKGKILLDGRREIIIILNEVCHPFPFKILHLI